MVPHFIAKAQFGLLIYPVTHTLAPQVSLIFQFWLAGKVPPVNIASLADVDIFSVEAFVHIHKWMVVFSLAYLLPPIYCHPMHFVCELSCSNVLSV